MPGALSSSSFPSPCSLFRPQVKYHFLWETSPDPLRLHAKLLLCGPFASRPPTPVVYVHHIVIITYNRLYLLSIRFSVYAWPKCLTNTYLMKGNMFVELMKRWKVSTLSSIAFPSNRHRGRELNVRGFFGRWSQRDGEGEKQMVGTFMVGFSQWGNYPTEDLLNDYA